MKILATFDGTPFSEATLPILQRMAALPDAELVLLSVAHVPGGRRTSAPRRTVIAAGEILGSTPVVIEREQAPAAETKDQAIERKLAEVQDYLSGIAARLPAGHKVHIEAHCDEDVTGTIIECARAEGADVIVMATHSRTPVGQLLFGSTTEAVIRSGVAPVLVVHPTGKA
jgi:nucleotide-binding universal stress UspA family protein